MNAPRRLTLQPLTRAAFAPFGEVIEADERQTQFVINGGTSQRFHDLARLEPGAGGRLIVSIFRAQARTLPFAVTMLERHPKASQAFMPLSGHPYLVVVAAPGALDPAAIQAFLARGDQGVNFAPGTWHHPLLALAGVSDFLVLDRDDPLDNCDEHPLLVPCELVLENVC
jgi:ureidoglycolate lyase